VTVQDAIAMLETRGWQACHRDGDVRQFHHADQPGLVTLVGKLEFELPRGVWRSLQRHAQIEEDD
jgi:predicted RNA binding protein YcfA (HicA-like mRNA interferase family)